MSLAVRTALQARQRGEVGRVMLVLITDGRANIGLARSNEEPDAMGPDAVKPTTVGSGLTWEARYLGAHIVGLRVRQLTFIC